MNDKKRMVFTLFISSFCFLTIIFGSSYAVLTRKVEGEKKYVITASNLDFDIISESKGIELSNAYPITDSQGMNLDSYTFSLINNDIININYQIKLEQIETGNDLDLDKVKVYFEHEDEKVGPILISEVDNLYEGTIEPNQTLDFSLKLWLDIDATIEEVGKTFKARVNVVGVQELVKKYVEDTLNGADPVLKDSLIPVKISSTGVVTKADLEDEWYSYKNNTWANAIILKDETKKFESDEIIPENEIESYFVWIPKYDYQIFNMGNYSSLGTLTNATRTINIRFTNKNTSNTSTECAYPIENNQAIAESTDDCLIGKWMTHPAFTTMGVNGFWIGKFETGYDGATSASLARDDIVDTSKIVIKPNQYSWSKLKVGTMFKNSYDYKRNLDSHMMKNTEWGAMAYLSASKYGYKDEISFGTKRTTSIINNNGSHITGYASVSEPTKGWGDSVVGNWYESTNPAEDGPYSINYFNIKSQLASTTSNYSGVYDISGGSDECVMGYTIGASSIGGASNITSSYPDFFDDPIYFRYWDKYSTLSTGLNSFNNRLLGDATGEMGPFQSTIDQDGSSRNKSSWYGDLARFIHRTNPWFVRGSHMEFGTEAGIFAFSYTSGSGSDYNSYRIVLSPTSN